MCPAFSRAFKCMVSGVLAFASLTAAAFDFIKAPDRLGDNWGVGIIYDVNNDGRLEPFGSLMQPNGRLKQLELTDQGLDVLSQADDNLYPLSDGRMADFNGDGTPDLVTQGYGPATANVRARLFFNDGSGHFVENVAFAAQNKTGRGEGLVVADFNNDGAVDFYLPYYTFDCTKLAEADSECPNAPQSYLYLNDGTGQFTEVATLAGVAQSPTPAEPFYNLHPEGAQAVDIDDNGFIDLMVAGKVFLNMGTVNFAVGQPLHSVPVPVFQLCDCGIPKPKGDSRTDEGAKFLDWNNDGRLDLLLQHWNQGPKLFEGRGAKPQLVPVKAAGGPGQRVFFVRRQFGRGPQAQRRLLQASAPVKFELNYGVNIYDIDNDGLEDIYVPGSATPVDQRCTTSKAACPIYSNILFRNVGSYFEESASAPLTGRSVAGNVSFGDINRDGRIDAILTEQKRYFLNRSGPGKSQALRIEVLGPNGERNQFGRVVRVRLPQAGCQFGVVGCTLTRVVDGGSGYRSQNQYSLLIGTPATGNHAVSVLFYFDGNVVETRFAMRPGQRARVYAPSESAPRGTAQILN